MTIDSIHTMITSYEAAALVGVATVIRVVAMVAGALGRPGIVATCEACLRPLPDLLGTAIAILRVVGEALAALVRIINAALDDLHGGPPAPPAAGGAT
jgi:hypothetical protein